MRRKGMAQHMWTEAFLDPRFLAELLTDLTNGGLMDREPWLVAGEQPVRWLPPAPINAQQLQQLRGEHDLPRESALALPDVNHHPLTVYVGDLEVLGLLATQSGT